MTIPRDIPGTEPNRAPDREFRYVSDDGKVPFRRLFRALTSTANPPKARSGGATEERCKLELPDRSTFQALSYRGDVEGWRADIEGAAGTLGLAVGRIEGDRFVVSDGRSFELAECKATFY